MKMKKQIKRFRNALKNKKTIEVDISELKNEHEQRLTQKTKRKYTLKKSCVHRTKKFLE
mgnify:CR=1 FL=1